MFYTVFIEMMTAINFDNKSSLVTVKIYNEIICYFLS